MGPALRKAADETLGLKDNIEARRRVDTVFDYSDFLAATGKRKDAIKYIQGGLKLNPFRLDQQLKLAKALAEDKDAKGATAAAEVVARRAEDDRLIIEAKAVLGQPGPDTSVSAASEAPAKGPAVVLVPVGDCDVLLLKDLAPLLALKLGIPVATVKLDVKLPKPARDPYADYLLNLGVRMKEVSKKDGKKFLDRLKLKPEDLSEEKKLLAFARAYILEVDGPGKVADLWRDLRAAWIQKQWEAEKLQEAVAAAAAGVKGPGVVCLGVTKLDQFAKGTNYVFGLSGQGGGIMSYARFRAEFEDEPPDRKRLLNRTLKQALSTAGFLFGAPRCTSPDCARAYPNSLKEHDAKSDDVCSACKEALEKTFAAIRRN